MSLSGEHSGISLGGLGDRNGFAFGGIAMFKHWNSSLCKIIKYDFLLKTHPD